MILEIYNDPEGAVLFHTSNHFQATLSLIRAIPGYGGDVSFKEIIHQKDSFENTLYLFIDTGL